MVALLTVLRDRFGTVPAELDLGGGHAIAYRPGEPALSPRAFADAVLPHLADRCARYGVPAPRLIVEPGRAIVGPAGIALYHVVAVKTSPSGTRFVAVDGGMSDNPRPALYGAGYTAYHLSMASGYNLVGRPPLIGVRDGAARALQRRETLDDILRRETAWEAGH